MPHWSGRRFGMACRPPAGPREHGLSRAGSGYRRPRSPGACGPQRAIPAPTSMESSINWKTLGHGWPRVRSAGRASLGADHIGARAPGGSHDLRLRGTGVTAPRAQGAPLRGPARGCRGCRASGGGGGRGRAPASRQPRPSSGTGGAPRRGDGRRAANPRPGERSALACIPWLARGGSGTTRRGDGKAGGA